MFPEAVSLEMAQSQTVSVPNLCGIWEELDTKVPDKPQVEREDAIPESPMQFGCAPPKATAEPRQEKKKTTKAKNMGGKRSSQDLSAMGIAKILAAHI